METRSNYTLTGLFVVVFTAAAVLLGLWIAGDLRQGDVKRYTVYVEESVSGLHENANVLFQGVPVGRVLALELDPNNPQRVRLTLAIESDAPVKADTRATLRTQGATGLMRLELEGGSPDAGPPPTPEGEPYPVIESEPSFWARLDGNVDEGLDEFRRLSDRLTRLLSEDNVAAAGETLENLRVLSAALARNRDELDRIMAGAGDLADSGALLAERLPATLDRLDAALLGVEQFSGRVVRAADDVSAMAGAGEAGIERFRNDTLPEVDALVRRLDRLATSLQQLSDELSERPEMLIQGQPEVEPAPGER